VAYLRFGRLKIKIKITSSKLIDLTGERFGRLRVVTRAESDKRGAARWFCRCDCGAGSKFQPVIVRADKLRRGETLSCGCLAVEKTLQRAADRPKVPPAPRKPRAKRSPPQTLSGRRRLRAEIDWKDFKAKVIAKAMADIDAEAKARG
jgi:hypothetical protein